MGINEAIIEKDFWVCWVLDLFFCDSPWYDSLNFKGGNKPFSKAFAAVEDEVGSSGVSDPVGKNQKAPGKSAKYRLLDAIGEGERIDKKHYLAVMETTIDILLNARYGGSDIYKMFHTIKEIPRRVVTMLKEKSLVPKTTDAQMIEQQIMELIQETLQAGKTKYEVALPYKFLDFERYRESAEYGSIEQSTRSAITRCRNKVLGKGVILAVERPAIVQNINMATELAILEQYTEIMVSKEKFAELKAGR